jgi:hypothetical protein
VEGETVVWFVQQQNVRAFAEKLRVEVDPGKREVLRRLLLDKDAFRR